VGSAVNEIYQREMEVPVGLEVHSEVVSESFPAAIRIGNELLALGDEMGHELIVNAEFAFVEGMTGAAAISAMAAMINAVLVKLYMPSRIFGEEAPDGR
jgi:hypothetical protein